jgi:hypothetical protein
LFRRVWNLEGVGHLIRQSLAIVMRVRRGFVPRFPVATALFRATCGFGFVLPWNKTAQARGTRENHDYRHRHSDADDIAKHACNFQYSQKAPK